MAFRIEETDEPGLEHFGEMGADRVRETVRLRITADTLADLIQGVDEIPVNTRWWCQRSRGSPVATFPPGSTFRTDSTQCGWVMEPGV